MNIEQRIKEIEETSKRGRRNGDDYLSGAAYASKKALEVINHLQSELERYKHLWETDSAQWKPVSELSKEQEQTHILYKEEGEIEYGLFSGMIGDSKIIYHFEHDELEVKEHLDFISEYCTFDDFINQHNSLLDRVERLEQIIGGRNE